MKTVHEILHAGLSALRRSPDAAAHAPGPAHAQVGDPRWLWPEIPRGTRAPNNATENYFKSLSTGYALVNELMQNANDAVRWAILPDGSRQRLRQTVTFTFRQVAWDELASIGFESVKDHVDACEPWAGKRCLVPGQPVDVLLCEDSGTGLTGDCEANGLPRTPAQKFQFEVSSGGRDRSKGGAMGGRFGIGAEAGPNSSSQRTAYNHTDRADGAGFACGRSSLKNHELGGRHFQALASYGTGREDGGNGPCLDAHADRVHEVFGFKRPLGEPGLSTAVIDPVEDSQFDDILASVVVSQMFMIARDRVAVVVADERPGRERRVELSRDTLRAVVREPGVRAALLRQSQDKVLRVLRHIDRVLGMVYADVDAVAVAEAAFAPGSISFGEADVQGLRETWDEGGIVKFTVPVPLTRKSRQTGEIEHLAGSAVVSLVATGEREEGFDIRVRDSILVVAPGSAGRVSITVASENPLGECIGDCEDPSHRNVFKRHGSASGWVDHECAVDLFKGAASWAARILAGADDERDTQSMARFFPMAAEDRQRSRPSGPRAAEGRAGVAVAEGEGDRELDDQPPQEGISQGHFSFEPGDEEAGFTFRVADEAFDEDGTPLTVVLKLQYASMSGGRKVFEGQEIQYRDKVCGGAMQISEDGSTVRISNVQPGFSLRVTGLDRNRDVTVTATIEEAA